MGNSNLHWTEETYIKYGDIVFDLLTAPPDTYSRTPEQVEFIDSILKKHHPSPKKILDIPCGDGRISTGLAKRGYDVKRVDISPAYADKASARTSKNKKARFLVGDMRSIELKDEFDAIVKWFGSFGYYDDETNEKVLERFVGWLGDKGLLIVDQTNRDYIIQKMGGFYEIHP